ncbi:hypothetical protein FNW52_15830 [Flavobacterium sp. ZT3R18]|uniref:hypothetical protein n=1 Tax=Flavobacterium sp. ZT3R18 TaxID=2594429 RepID=UPI00117A8612|nr:hypothetical protein [Flavobacterium sp. ZT3R18]TRX33227.1 hypothetical protein FNW52_15830 [Flavobacterium sp. ZT3R18]
MKYFNYFIIAFVCINIPLAVYSDFEVFKNTYSIMYCDNCFKKDTLVVYETKASSISTGKKLSSDINSVDYGVLKSNKKKKNVSYRNDFHPEYFVKEDTIKEAIVYYSKLNDYKLFAHKPTSIWDVNLKYIIIPLLYIYSIIVIIYYIIKKIK